MLPEFNNPPVSEVALSIEFSPLNGWSASQALAYGKLLHDKYPKMELQPPILSQIENFEGDGSNDNVKPLHFEIPSNGNRFWFLSDSTNWLIQIQNDRFVLNWRQVTKSEQYPRYLEAIRVRFKEELSNFLLFISQLEPGGLDVKQCEITYVNDILRDEGWSTVLDALSLITPLAGEHKNKYLPPPESINCFGTYRFQDELGNGLGRLHYSVNRVIRNSDQKDSIQLRLIARCRPLSSDSDDILKGFDMAREWIVRGFEELTTEKAHLIWGKKT